MRIGIIGSGNIGGTPERPPTVRTSNPQHSNTHSKRLLTIESQNTALTLRQPL